jgi:hypothetical protein
MLDKSVAFVASMEVTCIICNDWMPYYLMMCLLLRMLCWFMLYVLDDIICSGVFLNWSHCSLPGMYLYSICSINNHGIAGITMYLIKTSEVVYGT